MENKINEIPQYVIDGIASFLMPEIHKFYENPDSIINLREHEKEAANSSDTES